MRGGMIAGSGLAAAALSFLIERHGFRIAAGRGAADLLVMTLGTAFFARETPSDALWPWRRSVGRSTVPRTSIRGSSPSCFAA